MWNSQKIGVEQNSNIVRWFGVGLDFDKAWAPLVQKYSDLKRTDKTKVHPAKPNLGRAREVLYSSTGAFLIYEGHVKNCLAKPKDSVVISGMRGFKLDTLLAVLHILRESPGAVWSLQDRGDRLSNTEETTRR